MSSLGYQGRFQEAMTELTSAHSDSFNPLRRAILEFEAGDERQRVSIRAQLASPPPDLAPEGVASAYAVIGDHDAAIEWLERALAQRSYGLMFAVLEPPCDPLRGNARFERIVRGVGVRLPFPHPNGRQP